MGPVATLPQQPGLPVRGGRVAAALVARVSLVPPAPISPQLLISQALRSRATLAPTAVVREHSTGDFAHC